MSQETIEKKLAYLDETKQMIGQALVTKGQTINQETPFRDYVQKVLDIQTGFDTRDATAVASEVLKGKTFYNSQGKVEGTLVPKTGDIKKFETIEEMQNDANAQEGDLAIVYRKEVQNATVDSKFSSAIFPMEVVLPEAITDYVEIMYRAVDPSVMFDCYGQLEAGYFRMDCYTEKGQVRIRYSSDDGITYTRNDGSTEEIVDFGTEICTYIPEYWNDAIGYFITLGGMAFEGLYEYKHIEKTEYISFPLLKDIPAINENYDALTINHNSENQFSVSKIKTLIERIQTENTSLVSGSTTLYINTSGELISVWGVREYEGGNHAITFVNSFDYNTRQMTAELSNYGQGFSTSSALKGVYAYKLDLENMSYTSYPVGHQLYDYKPTSTAFYHLITKGLNVASVAYRYTSTTNEFYTQYFQGYKDITTIKIVNITITPSHYYWASEYIVAPTQLTLASANELLPGKIAYGKSGIIEGDGSIYNNLDMKALMQSLLNYDITNEAIFTYNQNGKTKKIKDIEPNGQECYTETINIYPKLPEEIKEKIASQIPSFFWCNDKYYVIVVKDSTGSTIYILDLNYNILNAITSDISYMNNFDICEENDNIYIILQNSTAINIYKFATEVNSLELVKNTTEPDKPYSYAFLLEVDELNDTYWLIGESASSKYSIYYSSISGNDSFTLLTTVSSSHDSNLRNQTAIEKDNNYIYCLIEHYSNYSILVAINRGDKTFKTWTGTANDCGPVAYIFKIGNTVYLNRIKSGLYKLDGINQTLLIAYDASKTAAIPWNMATYYLETSNTPIFTGDFHNSDYPEGRSYENPRYVYNSLTQKILNNGYIVNYTGVANTGFYGNTFYDLITYRDSNKIKSTWISDSYNNTCYMLVSTVYFNKMLEDTADISDILNIKSYPEGTISIRFNINPGALTSEEYQTALDTAYSIRDDEV